MPKGKPRSCELWDGEIRPNGVPFPSPAIEEPAQADQKPSVSTVQADVRTGLKLALTPQLQAKKC